VGAVDGQDVGVVEKTGGARLLLEAAQAVGIRRELSGQDLDRDVTPDPLGPRSIHFPHPARTEQGNDLVGTKTGPDRRRPSLLPRVQ
jgi:hypothetical protein